MILIFFQQVLIPVIFFSYSLSIYLLSTHLKVAQRSCLSHIFGFLILVFLRNIIINIDILSLGFIRFLFYYLVSLDTRFEATGMMDSNLMLDLFSRTSLKIGFDSTVVKESRKHSLKRRS